MKIEEIYKDIKKRIEIKEEIIIWIRSDIKIFRKTKSNIKSEALWGKKTGNSTKKKK